MRVYGPFMKRIGLALLIIVLVALGIYAFQKDGFPESIPGVIESALDVPLVSIIEPSRSEYSVDEPLSVRIKVAHIAGDDALIRISLLPADIDQPYQSIYWVHDIKPENGFSGEVEYVITPDQIFEADARVGSNYSIRVDAYDATGVERNNIARSEPFVFVSAGGTPWCELYVEEVIKSDGKISIGEGYFVKMRLRNVTHASPISYVRPNISEEQLGWAFADWSSRTPSERSDDRYEFGGAEAAGASPQRYMLFVANSSGSTRCELTVTPSL